jgi:hypothetical protein
MNEKIKTLSLKLGSLGDHMWLDGRDLEEQAVEKFLKLTFKAKELTIAEIESLLGYSVKVVK